MYLTKNAELNDMITYGSKRNHRKYFTGKQIKDVALACLQEDAGIICCYIRKTELENFVNKYVCCDRPLSNTALYSLSWCGKDMDELWCFRKKED